MKLFQIALLLLNVIAAHGTAGPPAPKRRKKATKPIPETLDVFWTKSRDKRTAKQKKAGRDPNPTYERRSNFFLIDSVDELTDVKFDDLKKEETQTKTMKALARVDEVTFEGLANDLQSQRAGMRAVATPIMKDYNEPINTRVLKEPTAVTDPDLPLALRMTGDWSITFTGLDFEDLKQMLEMKLKDKEGKMVSVNPDRIWGQLRLRPNTEKRIEKIETYFQKQTSNLEERTQSAPVQESERESELRRRAATNPTANRE